MKSLIALTTLILMLGCQRSEFSAGASAATQPDARIARIEVDGNPVADGVTPSTISVWLKNLKGEPLVDFSVEIEVSGSGNTLTPCTKTDTTGKALCWLATTVAEKKIVALKGTELTAPAHFVAPKANRDGGALIASGDAQTSSGGALIVSSIDFVGSFEALDSNQDLRLRSTHLAHMFAEIQ